MMTTDEITLLAQKVADQTATAEEKLALFKELNQSIEMVNQDLEQSKQ